MLSILRKEIGRVKSNGFSHIKSNHTQKRFFEFSTKGGRSSVAGVVCTVFGSTGFLGRYTVHAFGSVGTQVVIPYRGEESGYNHLKVMGDIGQIVPVKFDTRDPDSIYEAVKHSDIVINLLGAKWSTRNFSLEDVHIEAARRIALISKAAGVKRFIHVSTAQYDVNSPSEWIRTKSIGEDVVRESYPTATVLRPTILFGMEDLYTTKMAQRMRAWPVFPLIYPNRKVQPVFVNDVATAIMNCVKDNNTVGRVYELGGQEIWTNQEIFEYFDKFLKLKTKAVYGQEELIKKLSHILQYSHEPHFVPETFINESLDCVLKDPNAPGFKELGFKPEDLTSFKKYSPIIIRKFRKPIRFDEGIDVTYSGKVIDPRD